MCVCITFYLHVHTYVRTICCVYVLCIPFHNLLKYTHTFVCVHVLWGGFG